MEQRNEDVGTIRAYWSARSLNGHSMYGLLVGTAGYIVGSRCPAAPLRSTVVTGFDFGDGQPGAW